MRFVGHLAHGARRLLGRPVRSFLLLQGTVWGVAVAVFPSAVIEGTREAARTRAGVLGADRISLAPDPTVAEGEPFVEADVSALRKGLDRAALPVKACGGARVLAVVDDDDGSPGAVVAADPGATPARGLVLARGRWLAPDDAANRCVVEARVAAWLGRERLDPGDRIRLPGREGTFEVVGVTAPRSPRLLRTNDVGFDVEHPLYKRVGRAFLLAMGIPRIADAWKRSDRVVWVPYGGGGFDWIFLRVDATHVKEAVDVAARVFAHRPRSAVIFHPLVLPLLLGKQVERFEAVKVALFLACLAMGAVVMTNLGLLTVLRRRHEIAIRRVEGATRWDVTLQLVIEGLLLTCVGIGAGWVLGMLLAALRVSVEPVTGFAWRFPWKEALLAGAVAVLAGLLASLVPALRAGRQLPVEGLTDE